MPTDLRNVYKYIYLTIVPWMVKDGQQPYGPWLVFETPDGRRTKPLGVHYFADCPEKLDKIYTSQCKLGSQPYLQIQKASREAVAEHEDLKEEIARELDAQRTRSRKLAAKKRAQGEYTEYDNRPECVPAEGYTELFMFNQLDAYKPDMLFRNREQDHQIIIKAVPAIMDALDKVKDQDDISKIEEKLETLELDPMIRKVTHAVAAEWLEDIKANPDRGKGYPVPLDTIAGRHRAITKDSRYDYYREIVSWLKCSILANLLPDLPTIGLEIYCTQGRFGKNHCPSAYLEVLEPDKEPPKEPS
jgi:hypothetical protein